MKTITLQQALKSLSNKTKFHFTKAEGNTLITSEGIKLMLSSEFYANTNSDMPIQVILALVANDKRVWAWGSLCNSENAEIINWFMALRNETKTFEFSQIDNRNAEILTRL